MAWINPKTLLRAQGQVTRMAASLRGAGFQSSTLAALESELNAEFELNPKTGWLVFPDPTLSRVRTLANELELLLQSRKALYLVNPELPQLRYLLSQEVVG